MSHGIKDGRIYKGTNTSSVIGGIQKSRNRIYKGTSEGATIMKTSVIHSAIKDSKKYDIALMAAAYHFLIKPIF